MTLDHDEIRQNLLDELSALIGGTVTDVYDEDGRSLSNKELLAELELAYEEFRPPQAQVVRNLAPYDQAHGLTRDGKLAYYLTQLLAQVGALSASLARLPSFELAEIPGEVVYSSLLSMIGKVARQLLDHPDAFENARFDFEQGAAARAQAAQLQVALFHLATILGDLTQANLDIVQAAVDQSTGDLS